MKKKARLVESVSRPAQIVGWRIPLTNQHPTCEPEEEGRAEESNASLQSLYMRPGVLSTPLGLIVANREEYVRNASVKVDVRITLLRGSSVAQTWH